MFQYRDKRGIFQGRYAHTSTQTGDNRSILIFGGSEEKRTNDLLLFDLKSNRFQRVFTPDND